MPTEAYWLVVGKLFEDVEFLKKLKEAHLTRQDIKKMIKDKYDIDLSDDDTKLLLEQKGARKLNMLDTVFDARSELGM